VRATPAHRLILALTCGLAATASALGQAEYDFTLVEAFTLEYNLRECYLWDINDTGTAAGMSTYAFQNGGNTSIGYAGFTWADGAKSVLPMSDARAINNNLMVAASGTVFDRNTNQVARRRPARSGPSTRRRSTTR
jgi:hypothetical protein